MAIANPTDWRPGTGQWLIAEALVAHDLDRRAAFKSVRPKVGRDPLVFRGTREDGSYGPLPLPKEGEPSPKVNQYTRCWHRVKDVLTAIETHGWDREAGEAAAASEAAPEPQAPTVIEVAPEPIPAPVSDDAALLLSEFRRLRAFAEDRGVDHISYRPIDEGGRMLAAGLPIKAILHATTLHWEDATRRQAGIFGYDPETEFPGGLHAYLDALVDARVLVYLYGPAGMGKSYWARSLAERLGVPFGALSCNEQATPSWIVGRTALNGEFLTTKFLKIWEGGGVFLFDEVAASDPNFMMLVNDGLANGYIENGVDQKTYVRHPDCIIIFADNTLGTGADDQYIRNQLDFSTLDRCRMGRALVGYNAAVEEMIFARALTGKR